VCKVLLIGFEQTSRRRASVMLFAAPPENRRMSQARFDKLFNRVTFQKSE
jgi:hypothetical protein